MADVRIIDLPVEGALTAAHEIAVDLSETRKATVADIGNAARPYTGQADAVAGIRNDLTMTPLASAQQLAALGPTMFATVAEGLLASTALQPGSVGSLAFKNQISIPDINASGSPTGTTFLAGDGTWKFLPGGGNMLTSVYDPGNVGGAVAFAATSATSAQGAKADTALQPSAIGITVASAAQGAKADLVLSAFPSSSANVQGTGIPGLNGGNFFSYNGPAIFDVNPNIRIQRNMLSASTVGVSGNTYKALWVLGYTHPTSPGYEWTGTFEQHNRNSGTSLAQNVALNSTAFLESNGISQIGSTWGGNFVVDDREGVVNPGYARLGVEIDNFCLKSGGTDSQRNRVAVQIALGATDGTPDAGTPLHFGRAILINTVHANEIIDRVMELAGSGSYGYGIDTTKASFSGPVYMMKGGQKIAFDGDTAGNYNRTLYWLTGTLAYQTQNGVVFGITDAGAVSITGNMSINGALNNAGTRVVGQRVTGWTADTGTAKRTANSTYSATAEAAYTQATIQTLMNTVRDLSQTIKALKDDLIAHGLIGT